MTAPQVLQASDADDLAQAVAGLLVATIVDRQAAGRDPHIVLTGGGIGTAVLAALGQAPSASAVDWGRIEVWWGDERYLPEGHPDRNDTAARAALLDHVPVDAARVHAIAGPDRSADAEDSAGQYAATLARAGGAGAHLPRFDVVLLGIGPDAHVASLFPELPAVHETERTVVAVHGSPKPPPTRVSLTLSALNSADEAWILASGEAKAQAVRMMLDPGAGPLQVPAAGVHATRRTLIMVDRAAAALLPPGLTRPLA